MRRLTQFHLAAALVLFLGSKNVSAQEDFANLDPREAFEQLLRDPDVLAARTTVNQGLTITKSELRTVKETVMVPRVQRCGLFGRKRRTVYVPRVITRQVVVTKTESLAEIDWSMIDLASQEYARGVETLAMLPSAAGAKAELVRRGLDALLVEPKRSAPAGNGVFMTNFRFPEAVGGVSDAYSIVVDIGGNQDQVLRIGVGVARLQAGRRIEDEAILRPLAETMLQRVVQALRQRAAAAG